MVPGLVSNRGSSAIGTGRRLPVGTFLEAFETLDPRQQKAHLQSILKAAHIYTDGRIELEFRE
jgi:hypothetical protein